jgi:hypothetical protein
VSITNYGNGTVKLTDGTLATAIAAMNSDGTLQDVIGGQATEATLASILTELGQKLEPGGSVELGATTLAALENITVAVSGAVAVTGMPASVGQKTIALSLPVVLASDQTSIPVAATLAAGTAIAGKFGIDQTTPGTTNGVSALGTGINVAATTTQVASTSSDGAVVGAAAGQRLVGYSFRENAGAIASFVLRNGTAAGDPALDYVTLAAGESVREWYGPDGKIAAAGIYLDIISGTVIGSVSSKVVA